jgi:Tfp pilus assembly protein PilV
MTKLKNIKKGQSLFEVVFAVGMVSLVLITLVSLATSSIRNSNSSKTTDLATRSLEDGTEWVRSERDLGWSAFYTKASSPTYCLTSLDWTKPRSCGSLEYINGTIIQRSVAFTLVDASTVQADLKALWSDSQGTHQIVSSTYFTEWK